MRLGRALMVAAHADDESPGLGAVLEALVEAAIEVPAALPHGRGGFDYGAATAGVPGGSFHPVGCGARLVR